MRQRPPHARDVKASSGEFPTTVPLLQRKCACGGTPWQDGECAECRRKREQSRERSARPDLRNQVPTAVRPVLDSPGQPLDPASRRWMEDRLGHDFGNVRIHADNDAAESARSLNALAYTVAPHVVFAEGRFAPGTESGRRLLAHELTHVVQQEHGRAASSGPAQSEAEADRAAEQVPQGGLAGPIRGPGAVLQRQDAGNEEARQRAARAELACDIWALCGLRASGGEVVNTARILATAQRCHPGRMLWSDPCLMPEFMVPAVPSLGPRRSEAAPTRPPSGDSTRGSSPGGSGLNLSGITNFSFNLGPSRVAVSLPSSLTASLPVELRGSRSIEFSLRATTEGDFRFSVKLDGLPHVRISASAGVNASSGVASAALNITTTRTTCQAVNPETTRSAITAAGRRLQTAINEWMNPPEASGGAGAPSTRERLQAIASEIASMYEVIERAKRGCREVPVFSIGIRGSGPLDRESDEPSQIGVTGTLHF